MLPIELFAIYLGYETLIGVPLVLYFFLKNRDMDATGKPRVLRFFPLAGWIFGKMTAKESIVDALRPRIIVTPNLLAFVVCGIVGFVPVVWFALQIGNGSEWANKQDNAMALGFGILGDLFLFLWAVVVFVIYGLLMLLLYFLLIHGPAERKKMQAIQNQLWEAKQQVRAAESLAAKSNEDNRPPLS